MQIIQNTAKNHALTQTNHRLRKMYDGLEDRYCSQQKEIERLKLEYEQVLQRCLELEEYGDNLLSTVRRLSQQIIQLKRERNKDW